VVPVTTTETYTITELQSQSYTEQESYQVEEPYTTTETKTETVYDSYISAYNGSYSFVPKPGATISVSMQGSPYYYYPYNILNVNDFDHGFSPYMWRIVDGWGGTTRLVIKMTYQEETTKYNTVTKTRDVVKYRDVPVQVEKERSVTKYYRMSIWAYLFWDRK